jgi:hypothetical protein
VAVAVVLVAVAVVDSYKDQASQFCQRLVIR